MLDLIPIISVAALVDSINPCAISVLLLTIAFLLNLGKVRLSILLIGGAYILGIFIIYMLIGLGVLKTLSILNIPHFMAKVGALVLVAFGMINLINKLYPAFPIKLRIPKAAHQQIAKLMEKGSLPTTFALGGFVGLFEFPCTGGPYLMVLGLLHDKTTFLTGLGYLFLYNLIFVSPLILILLITSSQQVLDKVQRVRKINIGLIKFAGGVAMVTLGILIFLVN